MELSDGPVRGEPLADAAGRPLLADHSETGGRRPPWSLRSLAGRHKAATVSFLIILIVIGLCFLGPLFYHTDLAHGNLAVADLPPGSPGHPLGTDDVGFDELGRLMVGGRLSLEVGFCAALFATIFGSIWGAAAGYFGGVVDAVMMRIVDALVSMPSLFILIFIAQLVTLNIPALILLISYVAWLGPARLVRGEILSLKVRDFVRAGHTMGGGASHAIGRHLLPNVAGTMLVNATFQVADAILYVSALGYLGISFPPPNTDWGTMLSTGTQVVEAGYWWMVVFPGTVIVIVVLALNLIGDAVGDAFTARTRGQHV